MELGVKPHAGETVLITGALGSVGRTAVFVSKLHGARVIAGVKTEHLKEAGTIGADQTLAIDDDSAISQLGEVDAIGGDTVDHEVIGKLLPHLKKGGRLASVLGKPQAAGAFDIQVVEVWAKPDAKRLHALAINVQKGDLRIPVAKVLPLSEIQQAQQLAEKGSAGGKIVLALITEFAFRSRTPLGFADPRRSSTKITPGASFVRMKFIRPALRFTSWTVLTAALSAALPAKAQLGLYANFGAAKLNRGSSDWIYGPGFGAYVDHGHFLFLSTGIDLRGEVLGIGNSTKFDAGYIGPRVVFRPHVLPIMPYVEGLVGAGHVELPTSSLPNAINTGGSTSGTKFSYQFVGGVDYTILPRIDWRIAEFSYGGLSILNSSINPKTISTGIVIRLPAF